MCGVVGLVSDQPIFASLLDALARLEYRGYDSAGVALCRGGELANCRTVGKVEQLQEKIAKHNNFFAGATAGIAHVRWATHGSVTEANAHPQSNGRIAVVHNGIIENFAELREAVPEALFKSQTDTEVLVHLITQKMDQGASFLEATAKILAAVRGSFAVLVLCRDAPHTLIAARRACPLIVGRGKEGLFVASDTAALAQWCEEQAEISDDTIVVMQNGASNSCDFYTINSRHPSPATWALRAKHEHADGKGNFQSFTQKEMFEQPEMLHRLMHRPQSPWDFLKGPKPANVKFIGCGSSFYAGMLGSYWLEQLCGIAASAEIASEFRYREPVLPARTLPILISQSGETIDTIGALHCVEAQGLKPIVLTNVPHSTMAKLSHHTVNLEAGPEFGVVSTKAFTAQLGAIAALAVWLRQQIGQPTSEFEADLKRIPDLLTEVLEARETFQVIAERLATARSVLFLGRGASYPIALEGALKFKEISYVHAEGYPAGEMKHGPIALIDAHVPTVAIAPDDALFEKTLSNVQEVIARGGPVIFCTDKTGEEKALRQALPPDQIHLFRAPKSGQLSKTFVYAVLAQQIAYHTALHIGRDIDRPRNLAKSVTVE